MQKGWRIIRCMYTYTIHYVYMCGSSINMCDQMQDGADVKVCLWLSILASEWVT